ncbi:MULTISPECIES: hypothetical protein [unclassified Devosia]|uniref:hypothetical protein n=1 Tax=unclassified Devosia TaxID=196773 RepID=UPI001551C6E8|nr:MULTISPECIES: hypothetical protein [unclassified Devosia]
MIATQFDIAVVGSTPLAMLLAGLLAGQHRRRVIQVGERQSGLRLPRGFDLSAGALTRPETWALLDQTVPETLRTISKAAGRESWSRANPLFISEEPEGVAALDHIRHIAQGFGHEVEPVPLSSLRGSQQGWILRDVALLHRPALQPGLASWGAAQGVTYLEASLAHISVDGDGGGTLWSEEWQARANHLVLADDEAILGNVPPAELATFAALRPRATLLLRALPQLAAPLVLQLDRDMVVVQTAGGGVSGVGDGGVDELAPSLRQVTGPQSGWVQVGQARYHAVAGPDSAPLVGRISQTGPTILAGLGTAGAFLAPAFARWLAGVARPQEASWIEARTPARSTQSSVVTEFGVAALEATS